MKYLISFLTIISIFSCSSNEKNNVLDKSEETKIADILISIKRNSNIKEVFSENWNQLNLNYTSSISYLENNLDNKSCVEWGAPLHEPEIGYIYSIPCRADFHSLYLLNALYYDDFYFSFKIGFYDSTNCYYDSLKKSYCLTSRLDYSINSSASIEKAISSTRKWISLNQGKSLLEIRKGPRPFFDSPFYWFGEKGGMIDKNAFYSCRDLNL